MKGIEEKLLFLYKFARAPKQIGSVTPSSRFLAKKMVAAVPWQDVNYVAELGAGTGAITKFIARVSDQPAKVLLFEKDPFLRKQLTSRFLDYACYDDACKLQAALKQEGIARLDCMISGLPFFNFPQLLREQLMSQILATLKPEGLFIAFQYTLQMKIQLARHFDIEQIHFVPFNMPPAFVYVCRKRKEPSEEITSYEL
ncbi:phospholipid methyltransferase [Paenibacillus sp. SYP-B3998]|uniref:Phospholipid methyltransferase n=1 Tax=Paenibacillus sp. SYP-B3998 TaxID=2678564 RepID=A0A6G3ZWA8_9BACL|nr:phospholipid methyltransferase [Paenibacillus sp. SYP-B3998]NEW06360.1 phospholipid methyltransferase [Paenibacillus sp. SYP-B3998]